MKREGNYYVWEKGDVDVLSDHFLTAEFDCNCRFPECVEQKVAVTLIERLEKLRKEAKVPLTVTSGFRCKAYQAKLRGDGLQTAKGTSTHELGHAADVRCRDVKALEKVAHKFFKAIGRAKTFLHLDIRDDKLRRWDYI